MPISGAISGSSAGGAYGTAHVRAVEEQSHREEHDQRRYRRRCSRSVEIAKSSPSRMAAKDRSLGMLRGVGIEDQASRA